jgi:hypothetical protein
MKLSDDHDDQDEQDDGGPYYSNEEEIEEDYTEQSDISIDESEDEEIQRCDTTLLVTGRTERQHPVEALNKHMNIIHRTHRDKCEISHKSASKRDSAEPSFTHNPSGYVDSSFRSTKGLAYDMSNYA